MRKLIHNYIGLGKSSDLNFKQCKKIVKFF